MEETFAVVSRCADRPVPPVPSVVVQCRGCGADCWLSERTGAGTLGMAREFGTGSIRCGPCIREMSMQGREFEWHCTPAVRREALEAGLTPGWMP